MVPGKLPICQIKRYAGQQNTFKLLDQKQELKITICQNSRHSTQSLSRTEREREANPVRGMFCVGISAESDEDNCTPIHSPDSRLCLPVTLLVHLSNVVSGSH